MVASFCIPRQFCWIASIPSRWGPALVFVYSMIENMPAWKAAFGKSDPYSEYYSEDLAIASATQDGVTYPYSRAMPQGFLNLGPTERSVVNVYGMYSPIGQSVPPVDWAGPAGVRWPCTNVPQGRDRPSACSIVLERLDIKFTYYP